jgi:pyruvate ferredoxin oxidoreductase alpha subunit
VIVLERALAVGSGGVVSMDVRAAVAGHETLITTVVAGLGGRPITRTCLRDTFVRAMSDDLPDLSFLDLHLPALATAKE